MTQEYSNKHQKATIVPLEAAGRETVEDAPPTGLEIDLEAVRISQDFVEQLDVRKVRTTVPVRKPNRHSFIRVHPDSAYRLETAVLELTETRETYLVGPVMRGELVQEIKPTLLITTIDRQDVVFLWPIRLPDASGRHNPWHQSAMAAAHRAERAWIRVAANLSLGAYEMVEALSPLHNPEWPEESFQQLIQIAFRDRYINSPDHPVIQQLRGLV